MRSITNGMCPLTELSYVQLTPISQEKLVTHTSRKRLTLK